VTFWEEFAGVFQGVAEFFGSTGTIFGIPSWIFFWGVLFLSFALFYTLLNFIHFLKDNEGAKLVVAVILSIFFAANAFAVSVIAGMFPSLGVLLADGIGILILIAVFAPSYLEEDSASKLVFIAIAFIIAFLLFTTQTSLQIAGMDLPTIGDLSSLAWVLALVVIVVTIGLIVYIGRGASGG
jgi:hypothetical protein